MIQWRMKFKFIQLMKGVLALKDKMALTHILRMVFSKTCPLKFCKLLKIFGYIGLNNCAPNSLIKIKRKRREKKR